MLGGDSNGVLFKDWAHDEWLAKYNIKPPWGKVEFIALATALKRFEDEATARAAWNAFLADDSPYYRGHSPRSFVNQLGRWIPKRRNQSPKPIEPDARRDALQRIYREVYADPVFVGDVEKRAECSRRFKKEFPA